MVLQAEAIPRAPQGVILAQLRAVGDADGSFMGFSHWTLVSLGVYFCNTGVVTPRGEGRRLLASRGRGGKVRPDRPRC